MGGKDEAIEASMTVALVCYACRRTCDVLGRVDDVYLFGMMMKFELRYCVWDTSCNDCDR